MGRAKNTLSPADVSSTPIKVKYSATYASNSLQDYGISVRRGVNYPYQVGMSSSSLAMMNNYRVVLQLYYQNNVTGSVIGSASFWDPVWQSTAASSSGDETIYNFPTELTCSVGVLAIPSTQFGEQISRKTFSITSTGSGTQFKITDDGNGNLLDVSASNTPVGNIFPAQGVATITNPDYVGIFINPYFTITVI